MTPATWIEWGRNRHIHGPLAEAGREPAKHAKGPRGRASAPRDKRETRVPFAFFGVLRGLAMLLLACAARAHEFGDDYADTAASAQALTLNASRNGKIEVDPDADWFLFQASPLKRYTVTVTAGTLWDSTLDVRMSDRTTRRAQASSVPTPPSRVTFDHFGPPTTFYLRVAGFADFTTGTYSVVVNESNFPDLDGDGMDDVWEVSNFGSTNHPAGEDADLDGLNNRLEFLSGTSPTNPVSGLFITGTETGSNSVSVHFDVQPFRYYALSVCTDLVSGTWQVVQMLTNAQFAGERVLEDSMTPLAIQRFYRIECYLGSSVVGGPLQGATDLGGGWRRLAWLGDFIDRGDGWIYHAEHGWMYYVGTSPASIWFWSARLGWVWTSDTIYPFFWSDPRQAWLWYYRGTGNGAGGWFYNYGTGANVWL